MNALTANQVYQLPVQRYEFTQWETLAYLHELNLNDIEMPDEQRRLVSKIHCTHTFDESRNWRLGSLWFDEKPFLIYQEAGRTGDHEARYVTDRVLLWEAIRYAQTFQVDDYPDDKLDPDQPCLELTHFYGTNLEQMLARKGTL